MSDYSLLPSTPADRKKILDAFKEISDAHLRKSAETSYIKEAIDMLHDEFDIPKKALRKMSGLYIKQNAKEEKTELDDVFAAYATLTGEDLDD